MSIVFNADRHGTPVRSRPQACERKKKYPDERAAWDRMFEIRREKPEFNAVIYQCEYCKNWHFGNLPGRPRK